MKVTVYSKPECVQCDMTKRLMDKEGIEYESVDVLEDVEAMERIRSLGFSSVPVVICGDQSWAGFRAERIKGLKASK